ncbi:hypothetical protein J4231_00250 [Candidatus Woesearchaeota archaeon]|nr:hypothetical protein [Candidatus Woesearchaeota archaeon]
MRRIVIKFRKIEAKPDVNKSNLKLFIHYDENNIHKISEQLLLADEQIGQFVSRFMKGLRTSIKQNNSSSSSENFMDNFITIIVDEQEVGEAEENMVIALKKLRDKVRGFRSVKSADNYMNKFFDMSKLEVKL